MFLLTFHKKGVMFFFVDGDFSPFSTNHYHKEKLMMKKLLALLLATMMVLSLAACGEKKEEAPARYKELES